MEKKNDPIEEIWNKLGESKRILIPLHPKPDGDSLGSCAAMKDFLEKEGKTVFLISQDELSDNLKEFSFSKRVEFGKGLGDFNLDDFDALIFLDHGTLAGHPEKIIGKEFPEKLCVINIDHHHTNDYFGDLNYVDEGSPSCCSVLFNLFEDRGSEFDDELTRMLLLGICTDTNFGEYGNSADSFEKMALLIKKGRINFQKEFMIPILKSNPWILKKLHGILLSNMQKTTISGKTIVYSFATKEDAERHGWNPSDMRLGILCLQDIKDTDIVFTLTELEDNIKGSFRSRGIDTTPFSKEFGGGGHKEASSFYVEKMPMGEAVNKVLEMIEKIGIHKA